MQLETHKRNQAALSEAAKIRYTAIERVVRSLGALEATTIKYQASDRSPPSFTQAAMTCRRTPKKQHLFDTAVENLGERA